MEVVPTQGDELFLLLGNGQGLSIQFSGSASFPSSTNPYITLYLKNILYVPSINKKSCKYKQVCKKIIVYILSFTHLFVLSQVDNSILHKGYLGQDGLYLGQVSG